ncbi:AI-2E family transporter [Ilyomonas limi]|jgi:predicted PurR-regulated permease PerM|uniref:AI-2E family transporter n=1 Tax=Ilyomonas limi TaxID=2575867 RepID=A0A4U3L976_9BACT|nr:AI-2E family transporter [Ilyomonas limi]TKK71632.1 AI-2E family transporter [Ilyomonas limi]
MQSLSIQKTIRALLLLGLLVALAVLAKPFLVPLLFAVVVAMLLLPVTVWLQKKRLPQWLAVLLSVLVFLSAIGIIIYVLSWQVSNLVEESGNIEQQATKKVNEFQHYIQQTFGVPVKEQSKIASGQSGTSSGSYIADGVAKLLAGIGGFITDFILFIVYTFLLIYYRGHLKEFMLRMFFSKSRFKADKVIDDCRLVAQQYITGLALMILSLCIMYGIGFSIVGVKNAILFATLAAVLETVPFVGNITGTLLAILMTIVQGGSNTMIVGVIITYAAVQFIQTYLLEPLVVGKKVDINPLITIAGLVLAELIWGIPGMVLAIPLMGIAKIIFDNVEPLQPLGFLMGKVEK